MSEEQPQPRDETLPKFNGFRQTIKLEVHGEHVDFGVTSAESFGDRILESEEQPFTRQLSLGASPITLTSLGCDAFVTKPGVLVVQNISRLAGACILLKYGSATIRVRPSVPAMFEVDNTQGWSIVAEGAAAVPVKVTLFPR